MEQASAAHAAAARACVTVRHRESTVRPRSFPFVLASRHTGDVKTVLAISVALATLAGLGVAVHTAFTSIRALAPDVSRVQVCDGETVKLSDRSTGTLHLRVSREQQCTLECEPTDPWVTLTRAELIIERADRPSQPLEVGLDAGARCVWLPDALPTF